MIYTINEIQQIITPIAKKYRLRAVYLFGSYARNEATDASDIDVLIDTADSTVNNLFDMGGLYNDLCENLKKDAGLITLDALTQDSDKPWLTDNIMKERIVIYGK